MMDAITMDGFRFGFVSEAFWGECWTANDGAPRKLTRLENFAFREIRRASAEPARRTVATMAGRIVGL